MIAKVTNCQYCKEKMESATAKKRFCSDKCRIYFNREKARKEGNAELPVLKPEILPKVVATIITPEQSKEVLDGAKNSSLKHDEVGQWEDLKDIKDMKVTANMQFIKKRRGF